MLYTWKNLDQEKRTLKGEKIDNNTEVQIKKSILNLKHVMESKS